MNKSTRPNHTQRYTIIALVTLFLMQIQSITHADYTVQVGAFKDQARAARFVEKLGQQGFPVVAYNNGKDSKLLTRVRVGPYPDRTIAEHIRKRLNDMNIHGFLVPGPSSLDVTSAGTRELLAMASSNEATIQDTKVTKAQDRQSDSANSQAGEWRGYIEFEGTAFFENPAFPQQSNSDLSVAAQPEYLQEWNNGYDIFTFSPFYRVDQRDNNRTHGDIRELSWIHVADDWEVLAGIGKVFWGVTEAVHLVDIINQTDLVESFDGEEKLGQPMIDLSLIRDWGVVDLFVLPWFRDRTFPSADGRPRFAIPIDTGDPLYESSAEQHHVDFAARWSNSIGAWDIGLSYFYGTSREPRFLIEPSAINPVTGMVSEINPLYEIINQTSIDLQAIYGSWLWKLEAFTRGGQGDRFAAATGGFEYTFVGVRESAIDVGVITEYLYDGRDDEIGSATITPGTPFSTSPFQNDLVLGTRITLNDIQSTELLVVGIVDLEGNGQTFSVEASRRIGNDWVLALEGSSFSNVPEDTSLTSFKKDSFIRLIMTRYF